MFACIDKNLLHPSLATYIETDFVKSAKLVGDPPRYECRVNGMLMQCAGIHSTLRRKYYPKYVYTSRRRSTQKRGSSKKQGTQIDDEIFKYVKSKTKPKHWMTKRLIKHFEVTLGHTIQCTQLPVYIKELHCVTQVDVITSCAKGNLYMWEVKTGYPTSANSLKKGIMTNVHAPSNPFNHWELQRFFTFKGLEGHVNVLEKHTFVVNIYQTVKKKQKSVSIKAHKHPEWIKKLK